MSIKSPRLREKVQKAYKSKDKEVTKSARADKQAFTGELGGEADHAAAKGEIITKQLCGNITSQSVRVKDKDGSNISTEREQVMRWVHHFLEVLNRPDLEDPADPLPMDSDIDIDIGPPTEGEFRRSIEAKKCWKAAFIKNIHAEILKADLHTTTKLLTDLFRNKWEKDTIPKDWTRGLIVKIPKKGNLQNCDNWRGITLLSIPSEAFCRIFLW